MGQYISLLIESDPIHLIEQLFKVSDAHICFFQKGNMNLELDDLGLNPIRWETQALNVWMLLKQNSLKGPTGG